MSNQKLFLGYHQGWNLFTFKTWSSCNARCHCSDGYVTIY